MEHIYKVSAWCLLTFFTVMATYLAPEAPLKRAGIAIPELEISGKVLNAAKS